MVKAYFAGGAAGSEDYLVVDAKNSSGIELDPDFLFSADFIRQGSDLLLRGSDGKEILIRDYFAQDPPPRLHTAEGARLLAETVESLAVPETPLGYAQAGGIQLGDPIGEVSLLNGVARVQRPDGSRADLKEGDPIFQGDIVSTGVGSELGILFIDETVFSLSANARMVINELIYNPSSTTNSMGISLLQGTFVFVTGQVAPSGGMEVETPVGVIGIRGTTVGVQIATFGGRTSIANLTNPDTGETGSFTFSNEAGQALFSLANHFLEVRSASTDPGVPSISSGQDIVASFGRALNTAIQIQRSISQQQNDEPTEPDPTGDQEGQLEGEPLQAVQEAGLTQEQIDALLSEAPIETAAGPQTGNGNQPQSSGSSFAASLQPTSEPNPIIIFNSNVQNQIQGAAGGGSGGTPTPEQPQQQPESSTPPPPPPAGNTPPTVSGGPAAVAEGGVAVLGPAHLAASDAETTDPALLTYTVTGVVNGLVLLANPGGGFSVVFSFTQADVNAGRLRFAHDGSETTNAGFVVQVRDPGGALSAPKVVALAVAPVNDPPIAQDDSFTIDEHSLLAGSVLADNGNGPDSDVDGGPLTVTAVNGVAGAVGVQIELASGALLTLFADGSFDYDPNGQFNDLLPGASDEDSFTYTISDGNGGNDDATVTITIEGLNLAPEAADDNVTTDEDTLLSGNVLLDNGNGPDSDGDNDPLSVTAVNGSAIAVGSQITLASGALLTLNADGTFDYNPNGQFEGLVTGEVAEDTFTYTISDGHGGSDSATVTVAVEGVNDLPQVATQNGLVVKGTATVVDAAVLSASDIDHPNPADITFAVTNEDSGVVQLSGITTSSFTMADVNAGLVTFLHDDSTGSTAGFSVVASDPLGGSSALTPVSFTVAAGFIWTNGGGDGNWDNPANWAGNAVPVDNSDVTIATAGPATFSTGNLVLNNLELAAETLNVTGGSLTVIALNGDGDSSLNLSGGALTLIETGNLQGAFNWTGGTLDGDGSVLTVNGPAFLTSGPLNLPGELSLAGPSQLAAEIQGGGQLTNSGLLLVGGHSSIQPSFSNTIDGQIEVNATAGGSSVVLEVTGAFTQLGSILLTSTLGAGPGGNVSLIVSGGSLTNQGSLITQAGLGGSRTIEAELINEGSMTFDTATTIQSLGAVHSNEGDATFSVNAAVTVNGAASFRNSGQMSLATAATFLLLNGDFENALGGFIGGSGEITVLDGSFTNNGTINPGTSPGELTITGDYTQSADGILNIEIAAGGGDSLVVNGVADFAGSIFVTFLDGHIPTAGDVLDFIIADAIIDSGVEITGVNYAGGLLGIQLNGGIASFVAINGSGDAFVDPYEIIVGETGAGSLSIDAGQALVSQYLSVGEEASGVGTFVLTNASSLAIQGSSFIGNAGAGDATISGGAQAAFDNADGGSLVIGAAPGSDGSLLIADPGTLVSTHGDGNSVQVGRGGAGSLTSQNGFMTINGNDASLLVGVEAGSNGSVLFNGTQASLYMEDDNAYVGIGVAGTGALSLTNGGVLAFFGTNGTFSLGAQQGGTGSLLIDGPSALGVTGSARIGDAGAGDATISGGATASFASDNFDNLRIGNEVDSLGNLTVTGNGTVVTTSGTNNTIQVGWQGTGTLDVEAGAQVRTLQLEAGRFGDGTINIDGPGSLVIASTQFGAFSGEDAPYAGFARAGRMRGSDGEINVTNGGELQIRNGLTVNPDTVEPFLQIARNSGSNGAVTVDGSGSLIQLLQDLPGNPDAGFFGPTVQVGRLGTGSLTVSNNGQIRLDGDHSAMVVGARFGSSGSLDILSGGDVVIDGGSNAEHGGAGFARFGAAGQFYSRASVAVDAGSSIQVLGDETEIILGGSGLLDATIEGVIQNAGVSVSTTTIGSSDNYRVDVVVQGGGQLLAGNVLNIGAGLSEGRASLTVGAGSQVSAGTIFLQEAGRLAGSGQVITGLLQVDGGTVDPGLSPGLLSVSGDLLVNDGLLRFEVEGETAGSEHDRISVTGDASLHGGVVEIDFNAGLLLSGLGPINLLTTGGALSTDGSTSFRLVGVDTHDVLDYSITAGANALTLDVIDMYGGEGIVFEGGSRNDFERGGDGDDLLMGGLGDDTLGGGSGSDTLNGGGGFDRFQVTHDVLDPMGFNGDVITIQDFNPLEDVLELIGASSGGFGSLFIDEDINGNANVHIGGKIIVLVDVGQEELNAFNVVMRVTADGTLFTNPDGKIFLGGDGDGSIAISDGAVFDSGPARIAVDGFNNGSVDVSGGGTLWRITTDDVDDAVVVGNNNNGDGDSTGFLGTLDISDGARVRIAGDEATPFVSTGLIIGRGGHGSVEITNGGELEILDPALIGQDVFLLLGGSGAQQNGVGEMLVDGAGSRVLMQGETVSVAVGRNGFDAEGVLTISSDAEFELTGISGAFFNLGREGANGTLQIDGGRLYINSALDPALQLGRHGDSFAIATVENGGLIEINGSEAFLAVGRVGHSESPMSILDIWGGSQVRLDGQSDNAYAVIGRDENSKGAVSISDKDSELSLVGRESFLTVGNEGLGFLNIEAGGSASALAVTLGRSATGMGSAVVDGLSVDETQRSELRIEGRFGDGDGAFLQVGREGQGTLTVSNGGLVSIDGQGGTYPGFTVGGLLGSVGIVNVTGDGSEILISNGSAAIGGGQGFIAIGREGSGTVVLSDGGQIVNGPGGYTFIGRDPTGNGNLLLDGTDSAGAVFDAGAVLIIGADFDFTTGLIDFQNGGLGVATVTAGTTLRAGAAEGDGISDIFLGSGGTLNIQNGGTVIGDIENVGGTLINGNSPGTANFGGDFAMSQGFLEVEIAGSSSGTFDLYQVAGTASLNGGTIGFVLIDGFAPTTGTTVEFLTAGAGMVADIEQLSLSFDGVDRAFEFAVDITANGARVTVLNDAGAGDSLIYLGGGGSDDVRGGAGDDYLDGGGGRDTLFGGAGADSFVVRAADAAETLDLADLITDFEVGIDHLGLVDGLTAGDLALTSTAGGDAVVSLKSTGAYLAILQGVNATDITIEEITATL